MRLSFYSKPIQRFQPDITLPLKCLYFIFHSLFFRQCRLIWIWGAKLSLALQLRCFFANSELFLIYIIHIAEFSRLFKLNRAALS